MVWQNKTNRHPSKGRKSRVTTLCRCKIHPTLKGVSSVRTLQHLLNFVSSFTLGKAERCGWGRGHSQNDGLKTRCYLSQPNFGNARGALGYTHHPVCREMCGTGDLFSYFMDYDKVVPKLSKSLLQDPHSPKEQQICFFLFSSAVWVYVWNIMGPIPSLPPPTPLVYWCLTNSNVERTTY